jgi:peptidoglycan hydrolase-like protein with peptidoglycan-binding domain
MKRSNILLAFVATGALVAGPAFARQSRNETASMHIKSSTLMEAQKKLNQEGFDAGRADGRWGTKTAEAVKSFQEKNNLPPTGKLEYQIGPALRINEIAVKLKRMVATGIAVKLSCAA